MPPMQNIFHFEIKILYIFIFYYNNENFITKESFMKSLISVIMVSIKMYENYMNRFEQKMLFLSNKVF